MFPLMLPRRLERGLVRRESDPFRLLFNRMGTLLDRFADDFAVPEAWLPTPAWTVEEAEKEVVLRLELPGFEPAEIEVTLEGTMLLARAIHVVPETANVASAPRREAVYRFELPTGLDLEHLAATYRNGVLEVHVPRLPGMIPRRIEVKT